MHDLVVRGATVVDGNGTAAFTGDVAVTGGRIVAVGGKAGPGRREVDADGLHLLPGWVDCHTHYDGQVTWDPLVSPSSAHGVTTVVMGNCGVGFAPVRPDAHERLIELMEGVEDIPGSALAEGMTWGWESFPEYLDALAAMPRVLDIGAQVPHNPVRAYVMGDAAYGERPATGEERAKMAELVAEGLRAGALGFTTSLTRFHNTSKGEPAPSRHQNFEELLAIARAMRIHAAGVIGLNSDLDAPERDVAAFRRISMESGCPLYFLLVQFDDEPEKWRRVAALCAPNGDGAEIRPQIASRPVGLFMGLEASLNPFLTRRAYRAIASLPLPARLERLRDPDVRRAILGEVREHRSQLMKEVTSAFDKQFRLGDPPDYEPAPEQSIAATAAREGRSAQEVAYDILLEREGRELIFLPFTNYTARNHEVILEMMRDERNLVGLGDGGAHCGLVCDASMPTHLLTHWVRDRRRGPRVPLEWAVRRQTWDNAAFFGMRDRGRIAPGMRADLNLVDLSALRLHSPRIVHDLPAGGRRLVQGASGYAMTLQSGVVTFEAGEHTGALPGRLVRGRQPAGA